MFGPEEDLDWLKQKLRETYPVKFQGRIGADGTDDKRVRILSLSSTHVHVLLLLLLVLV